MIYYLKRLNSHTAAAETFNVTVSLTSDIGCGTLCSISSGYLSPQRSASKVSYLTLEEKKSSDGKRAISCVRLAPEMVLKATTLDDITAYKIGDGCSFVANSEEITENVTLSGNECEVIAVDDKYVTFITR